MVEAVGGRLRGCGRALHHAMPTTNCNTSNTWVFDPFNALDLSGWHHGWCRYSRETLVGKEEEAPVSSEEEKNKALARRYLVAQMKGDLETLDELLAPDFVDHSLFPGQDPGREGFMQSAAEEHAIFSNVRIHIEDQAAEEDK